MTPFTICCVVTRDRFAYLRVLARSVHEQHPDVSVIALVADAREGEDHHGEPFSVLTAEDIGLGADELARRAAIYSAFELTGSLKAPLLLWAVEAYGQVAFVLDCDVRVYGDLSPVAAEAERAGVLLSPHEHEPEATHDSTDSEVRYLSAGIFNGGFIGASPEGVPFLRWWTQRTARHCLNAPADGFFVEQCWLSLAPGLFEVGICRDPGANVMGWRLRHDDVDAVTMRFMGADIRFFHFCGRFDPHQPGRLTTMDELEWPAAADRPGAATLCRRYARELLEAGFDAEAEEPYLFGVLQDGRPIDQFARRAYRAGLLKAERHEAPLPPNPFTNTTADFMTWLASPEPDCQLSRYYQQLWTGRLDLQAVFPSALTDSQGFLDWIRARPEHMVYSEVTPRER